MRSSSLDLLLRACADEPGVAAVLLGGSLSTGEATAFSDVDACVITFSCPDALPRWFRSPPSGLDLSCMSLDDFVDHAACGSATEYERYAFTHVRVLLDRTNGTVPSLCREKGTLPSAVARERSPGALDAYLNSYYRALKNRRDGRELEFRLDAGEAVDRFLSVLLLLHERLRPYNKYLLFDLRVRPLPGGPAADEAAPLLTKALRCADLRAHAALFRLLEPLARQQGYGSVLDAWRSPALAWMAAGECSGSVLVDRAEEPT